jgi:hypothetical protein
MELNPFVLIQKPIGSQSGWLHEQATSLPFPLGYVSFLTGPSEALLQIMISLSGLLGMSKCFGAQQEQVRVVELGTRQEWMLIVRIPEVNFGVAIRVRRMLLSTNFEEVSMLPTYCDGLTVTLYEWRSKGHPYHLLPPGYGSHQILNLATGIPSWT